jgi:chemotaxis protein CheX
MMRDAAPSPIQLPPVLDLAAAEPLRRELTARWGDGELRLNGAAVERIATPCLQVLAAAALSARNRQAAFRLSRPSDALRAAIADLGLRQTIPVED